MRLAIAHFGIQHQAHVANPVGVHHVARAPRFARVVAHLSPVLVPIQRLDRGVGVEDPPGGQRFVRAVRQRLVHPRRTAGQLRLPRRTLRVALTTFRARCQMRQRPAQTLVADDALHAQDLRRHRIPTQPGDMRIPPLTIENRQQPGAQHVPHRWGVGAAVVQRAAGDPVREQPGDLQKLGEERQLPQRRRTTVLVPPHLEATARRAHPQFRGRLGRFDQRTAHGGDQRLLRKFSLTHRVTLPIPRKPRPVMSLPQLRGPQPRKIG